VVSVISSELGFLVGCYTTDIWVLDILDSIQTTQALQSTHGRQHNTQDSTGQRNTYVILTTEKLNVVYWNRLAK